MAMMIVRHLFGIVHVKLVDLEHISPNRGIIVAVNVQPDDISRAIILMVKVALHVQGECGCVFWVLRVTLLLTHSQIAGKRVCQDHQVVR